MIEFLAEVDGHPAHASLAHIGSEVHLTFPL